MEVKTVINEKYTELEIHVCSNAPDGNVREMVAAINELVNRTCVVKNSRGDRQVIAGKDIVLIYAEGQHVYVKTEQETFQASAKIYEMENELDPKRFLRISRAEIINIKKIRRLDFGMTGTVKVILSDGSECYTSRRNIIKLKKALGL